MDLSVKEVWVIKWEIQSNSEGVSVRSESEMPVMEKMPLNVDRNWKRVDRLFEGRCNLAVNKIRG